MQRKYIFISFVVVMMATISGIGYFKGIASQPSGEASGLMTSQIEITSTSQTERWEAVDGYAGRFPVNQSEKLNLRIQLARLEVGKPVLVQAPHGGVLNGNQSHLTWTPQSADEVLELSYQVGRARGVYLISLRQGQREEVIEFWAGELTPLGEVGPQTVEAQ